jgi:hypothetical protein
MCLFCIHKPYVIYDSTRGHVTSWELVITVDNSVYCRGQSFGKRPDHSDTVRCSYHDVGVPCLAIAHEQLCSQKNVLWKSSVCRTPHSPETTENWLYTHITLLNANDVFVDITEWEWHRSQWLCSPRRRRSLLGHWDCGFESCLRHACLFSRIHHYLSLITPSSMNIV